MKEVFFLKKNHEQVNSVQQCIMYLEYLFYPYTYSTKFMSIKELNIKQLKEEN